MKTAIILLISDIAILALSLRDNFIGVDHSFVKFYDWKWDDIAEECEYFLGPKGRRGIQITFSKIKNTLGSWSKLHQAGDEYHVYLNLGDQSLASMIRRCNAVGVRVYVDGLFNPLTTSNNFRTKRICYLKFLGELYESHATWTAGSYIRNCLLYDSDDTCKSHEFVVQDIIDYMNNFVNMGVAGFNVETSKQTSPINFEEIYGRINDLNINHGFDFNTRPLFYQAFTDTEILTPRRNNFMPSRNTIVHLFEWKWNDIAEECEGFLGPKGYAGVQISPPSENQVITVKAYRPWWERYQPVSYKLYTRSGDEFSLADMIRRCNEVGVRIYADVVFNHMAAVGGRGTDGTTCNPSRKYYPGVPYTIENFHESCAVNNYNDATNVRNCELVHLKDLDQSQEYVRHAIVQYLNHLVSLGIAGFRIDAAKHMWPSDLRTIYSRVDDLATEHGFPKGTRPFFYQEVIDLGGEAISKREYIGFGAVLEFKFGAELGNAFQGNNPLKYLKNWGPDWGLLDGNDAVAFIDNHDNQRGTSDAILTYKKPKQYRMAIAFMLAHPYGTTRIMSSFLFDTFNQGPPNRNGEIIGPGTNDDGSCTNGWVCEHRWRQIYNMVGFRNAVEGTVITNWWDNDHNQIAFGRGEKGFIAFTLNGHIEESFKTSLPTGMYCDIISGSLKNGTCTGKSVEVDGNGYAAISLRENEEDGAVAIHVNAKL